MFNIKKLKALVAAGDNATQGETMTDEMPRMPSKIYCTTDTGRYYVPLDTHEDLRKKYHLYHRDDIVQELVEALERLSQLGNGDMYGNSDGNVIAQHSLAKFKGEE